MLGDAEEANKVAEHSSQISPALLSSLVTVTERRRQMAAWIQDLRYEGSGKSYSAGQSGESPEPEVRGHRSKVLPLTYQITFGKLICFSRPQFL